MDESLQKTLQEDLSIIDKRARVRPFSYSAHIIKHARIELLAEKDEVMDLVDEINFNLHPLMGVEASLMLKRKNFKDKRMYFLEIIPCDEKAPPYQLRNVAEKFMTMLQQVVRNYVKEKYQPYSKERGYQKWRNSDKHRPHSKKEFIA